MNCSDEEAAIAEHWGKSGREFASAVVEQLLPCCCGNSKSRWVSYSRSTDGLLPQYEEIAPESYFGTAVHVFLPDQSVEPVSLDFSFDPEAAKLRAAIVHCGWPGAEAVL